MTVRTFNTLPADLAVAVRALNEAATDADGVSPLGEATLIALTSADVLHLVADDGTGYAQVDNRFGSAELAVHPDHRRQGVGRELLDGVLAASPDVGIWAHGDLPAARALAAAAGLVRDRELELMHRDLAGFAPDGRLPDGVTIRTFTTGDEQAWLDLNAAAFADHPEQGKMTHADLAARMQEAWFDPTTFWLAEVDGRLVGSLWGKVVDDDGEVYAVSVAASQRGTGLGTALVDHALTEFHRRGLARASLYVDADNPATALYERAGYAVTQLDVQYRQPLTGSSPDGVTMAP